MPSITPNLWFDTESEEAAEFYTSIFPNSRVLSTTRYTEAGPGEPGTVVTVEWELDGRPVPVEDEPSLYALAGLAFGVLLAVFAGHVTQNYDAQARTLQLFGTTMQLGEDGHDGGHGRERGHRSDDD